MNRHDSTRKGSRLRLVELRAYANAWNANPRHAHKITWREARKHRATFATRHHCARSPGLIHMDSGALDHLREVSGHDVPSNYGQGWYCDAYQSETIAGRVSALPHGRFIAWIVWSDCDDITVDASIYHDARTAWFRADDMARRMAEEEREHSERWNQAREHAENRDAARVTLRNARSKARALVQALRDQGAIVPSLCDILRERIAEHRAAMRAALDTIEEAREGIRAAGMEGQF